MPPVDDDDDFFTLPTTSRPRAAPPQRSISVDDDDDALAEPAQEPSRVRTGGTAAADPGQWDEGSPLHGFFEKVKQVVENVAYIEWIAPKYAKAAHEFTSAVDVQTASGAVRAGPAGRAGAG